MKIKNINKINEIKAQRTTIKNKQGYDARTKEYKESIKQAEILEKEADKIIVNDTIEYLKTIYNGCNYETNSLVFNNGLILKIIPNIGFGDNEPSIYLGTISYRDYRKNFNIVEKNDEEILSFIKQKIMEYENQSEKDNHRKENFKNLITNIGEITHRNDWLKDYDGNEVNISYKKGQDSFTESRINIYCLDKEYQINTNLIFCNLDLEKTIKIKTQIEKLLKEFTKQEIVKREERI